METVNNVQYTTTSITFVEARKSASFGENGRYDVVFTYTDGVGGLNLMGCSNRYSVTAAFEKKAAAEDCLQDYGDKGVPAEMVGVTVALPNGVQRSIDGGDEWQDCHFVRLAAPAANVEQCATAKLAQILRQCKDTSNDYWRIVELLNTEVKQTHEPGDSGSDAVFTSVFFLIVYGFHL